MALTIISRQEWGAIPVNVNNPLHMPVADVFLHHEGGGVRLASLTQVEEMAIMRELQIDTMARGYADFPYGVAVFGSGRVYEGRDLGFVNGGTTQEEAAT